MYAKGKDDFSKFLLENRDSPFTLFPPYISSLLMELDIDSTPLLR